MGEIYGVERGREWDSGFLRPGVRGSAARRKAPGVESGQQKQKERDRNSKEKQKEGGTGSGNKIEQVYTIIERFVRLSTLAAAELEPWEGG